MKKLIFLCLLCLIFVVGCSSDVKDSDSEKKIAELEKEIQNLNNEIDKLSQNDTNPSSQEDLSSDLPVEDDIPAIPDEDKSVDENSNIDISNYAQHGILCLNDMDSGDISKLFKKYKRDYPKEGSKTDEIKEHYNTEYDMQNVNVDIVEANGDPRGARVKVQFSTDPTKKIDYVDWVTYSIPFRIKMDGTLSYAMDVERRKSIMISLYIYDNYEKASALYNSYFDSLLQEGITWEEYNTSNYWSATWVPFSEAPDQKMEISLKYDSNTKYYNFVEALIWE